MNKHTPTPWVTQRISEEDTEWTASEIIGSNDYFVSTMVCKQVDAEHIIRCVNSHEALVQALKEISEYPVDGSWGKAELCIPDMRKIARKALASAGAPQ